MGYRFRLYDKGLPGTPDVVMARHRIVVLVHGCFWHRHEACPFASVPKTRKRFWRSKFSANIARDRVVKADLRKLGWHVMVLWECELRNMDRLAKSLAMKLERHITLTSTPKG
jgi:DNA mismatch endonuclease (patch repair protein)